MSDRRIAMNMEFNPQPFTGRLDRIKSAAISINRVLLQNAHPIDRVDTHDDDPPLWPGDQA